MALAADFLEDVGHKNPRSLGTPVQASVPKSLLKQWMAWDNGFRQVICETNYLDAFNLVKCDLSSVMDHRDLVSKIKDTELLSWFMSITFIQRSANTAADLMAKQAASSQLVYTEWSIPSDDLKLIIHQDSVS
ncbi:hypothetical protein PIB30_009557 [Stylosanthes scabra]|uniref:RNase H type-1 domain-containing protein n=1 Tax=Stylosanthes scabra TaxID=79078 RepID=A0ABU6Q6A0_9FABA|nr:hypothetical protein [Stylosanthes scabra]